MHGSFYSMPLEIGGVMRELEITKTKLGEKVGSYKGQYTIFSVYYGNYVSPTIGDEFVHLKEPEYEELLKNFLESDAGKEYRRPAPEEIKKAAAMVLNSELVYLKDKQGEGIDLAISSTEKENAQTSEKDLAGRKKIKILSALVAAFVLLETSLSILFIIT